jgi:hypothetical protein
VAYFLENTIRSLLDYCGVLDLAEYDRRVALLLLKLLIPYLEWFENTQTEHGIVTEYPSKYDPHYYRLFNLAILMSQKVHADDDTGINAEAKQYSEIASSLCRAEDMHIDLFKEPEQGNNRVAKDAEDLKDQGYEVRYVSYSKGTLELNHVACVQCREFGNANTASNQD